MRLNPDKTEMLLVGSTFDQMGGVQPVLDGFVLPRKEQVRSLGVLLDPSLSLEVQVASVAERAFYLPWLVAQLCPYLGRESLASVTDALVISRLEYFNTVYMQLPLKTVQKLLLVQNMAARLITET